MTNLILMPNDKIFAIISLYFLCTGSFFLSYKFVSKINGQHSFSSIYLGSLVVNTFILVLGLNILPNLIGKLFPPISLGWFCFLFLASYLFAYLFLRFEMALYRTSFISIPTVSAGIFPVILALIGVLEEIIFRGLLNGCISFLHKTLFYPLTIFAIFSFAISHLFFGWIQFFSKLTLSFCMTGFYFVTGNIWLSLFCHSFFNFWVAKKFPYHRYAMANNIFN